MSTSQTLRLVVGNPAPTSTTTRSGLCSFVTVYDVRFCTPRPNVTVPSKSPALTAVITLGSAYAVASLVVEPFAS